MSDVNISVGANDNGGAAVIDKITAALSRLRALQQELAKLESEGQIRDEKGRFLSNAARDARIAATQAALNGARDTVEAVRKVIAIEQEQTKMARAAAAERAAQANAAAAQAKSATAAARIAVAEAQAQAAAQRALAAAHNQGAASARAQGAAATASARQAAAAAQAAAAQTRLKNTETLAAAQAARAQAAAELQQARAAQQTANNAARATLQQQRMTQQLTASTKESELSFGRLYSTIARLYALMQGANLLGAFVREGMDFNTVVESATLGIASLITAEAKITNVQGEMLTGATALSAAYTIAADQMQKLRIAGLETKATTVELAEAMQQAVGPGLSAGLNMDQIRDLTVKIVQAAGAIGVPMNQLSYQIRSMLSGQITRNSRVANALMITNEEIRNWKEAGTLAQELDKRMEAFNVAGKEAALTWSVIKSNMHEGLMVFAGDSVRPMFDQLKKAGLDALSSVFDLRQLKITDQLRGLVETLQSMFGGIGAMLANGIRGAVSEAKEFSAWLDKHRDQVDAIMASVGNVLGAFGDIIVAVGKIVGWLINAGTETNTIAATLNTIADVLRSIANIMPAIVGLIALKGIETGVAALSATVAGFPLVALAAIVTAFTALYLITKQLESAAAEYEASQRRQEQAIINSRAATGQLANEYKALKAQIDSGKLSREQLNDAHTRLNEIVAKLVAQNPSMRNALQGQAADAAATASNINKMTTALDTYFLRMFSYWDKQRTRAQERLRMATLTSNSISHNPVSGTLRKQAADELAAAQDEFAKADAMRTSYINAEASILPGREVTVTAPKPDQKPPKNASMVAGADISVFRQQLKTESEALKLALEQNKMTVNEYVQALEAAQRRAANAEIGVLDKEISGMGSHADPNKVKAIRAQQAKIREQLATDQVETEKFVAGYNKRFNDAVLQASVVAQRAGGESILASLTKFESQYAGFIEEAKLANNQAALKTFSDADSALRMADALGKTKLALSEIRTALDAKVIDIKQRASEGEITPGQAKAEIDAAYDDAKAKIQSIIDMVKGLRDSGQVTGPVVARVLDDLGKGMNAVEKSAVKAEKGFKDFFDTFKQDQTHALTEFLNSGIDKVHGLGDAFRGLADSVVASIRKIVSELIAAAIIKRLFSMFGGGNIVGTVVSTATGDEGGVAPDGYAEGGYIRGPGTGTSDSIPSWLSNGEYVMRAAAVQAIGKDTLDMMNYGSSRPTVRGRRAFADGGLVASGAAGGSPQRGGFDAHIGLEPGLVAKHLKTREGTQAILQTVGTNRKAVRAALGL